jgi:fibronectin type 3 domain-containing protein
MNRKSLPVLLVLIFFLSAVSGCLNDIEKVPLDIPDEDIEAPQRIEIVVNDGEIALSWGVVVNAASYKVYRSRFAEEEVIAETQDTFYVDNNIINGNEYYYSVASVGNSGLEGDKTDWVLAVPSIYSLSINNGVPYTNSVNVNILLTAPESTRFMKISNDSTFSEENWESFRTSRNWELEQIDGEKHIYAVFQDANGNQSSPVRTFIILDTYSGITNISITPDISFYGIGEMIHFVMHVEGDEAGGEASILIEGYTEIVKLYDNQMSGDNLALDGVYERDFYPPVNLRGIDLLVHGRFTDRAGNMAPDFESEEKISFQDPPLPIQLLGVSDSTTTSITLKWVASVDENFEFYRVYRDTDSHNSVDFENALFIVDELSNQAQTSYQDNNLMEGEKYYYRVYVINDLDESAGSNEISGYTYDAFPEPVVLDTLSSVGIDRVTLTWSQNQDSDFLEYRIYRSISPGVTSSQSDLVTTISQRETRWYDDLGLDLITENCYYRVYVYDMGNRFSRSNEVTTAQ